MLEEPMVLAAATRAGLVDPASVLEFPAATYKFTSCDDHETKNYERIIPTVTWIPAFMTYIGWRKEEAGITNDDSNARW